MWLYTLRLENQENQKKKTQEKEVTMPVGGNILKLSEIRTLLKDNSPGIYGKITVISRDGNTVCRSDIGSPRNSNLKRDMFHNYVNRILNIQDTTAVIFKGRKGIYTHYWVEVILSK